MWPIRSRASTTPTNAPTTRQATIVTRATVAFEGFTQPTVKGQTPKFADRRTSVMGAMGLAINVTEHPTRTPGVVRFEADRGLTGMAHERYASLSDIIYDRPPDRLAKLLFERGGVRHVHIYGNEVTVRLEQGASTAGIADLITNLFIHYREGVTPSIIPEPDAPAEATGS